MPIDINHPLIAASRYADAQAEEMGLIGAIKHNSMDVETLIYAAQQRALRLVILTHLGPEALTSLSRITKTPIALSEIEEQDVERFTLSYLDGMFIGWKASKISDHTNEN